MHRIAYEREWWPEVLKFKNDLENNRIPSSPGLSECFTGARGEVIRNGRRLEPLEIDSYVEDYKKYTQSLAKETFLDLMDRNLEVSGISIRGAERGVLR